jgi:hypothetical protein
MSDTIEVNRLRAEFPQPTTSDLLIRLKRDTVSDHVSTREIAARLIMSGLRTNEDCPQEERHG